MSFIKFDAQTGLVVKTKANILKDLTSICEQAYGQSFVLAPGTEMYTLIDFLSSQLAECGSAVKAVYDAFGFTTATGTPLDVLCSLAGIYRQAGETDNDLRARYFIYLYAKSVSTVDSLYSKILDVTVNKQENINGVNVNQAVPAVSEVRILNNETDVQTPVDGLDVPAHGIAVICKHTQDFPQDSLEYTNIRTEISNIVENYKSLGCATKDEQDGDNTYRYIKAKGVELDITFEIIAKHAIPNDQRRHAFIQAVSDEIKNYVLKCKLGENITFLGIAGCIHRVYTNLGYFDSAVEASNQSFVIKKDGTVKTPSGYAWTSVVMNADEYVSACEITITDKDV